MRHNRVANLVWRNTGETLLLKCLKDSSRLIATGHNVNIIDEEAPLHGTPEEQEDFVSRWEGPVMEQVEKARRRNDQVISPKVPCLCPS